MNALAADSIMRLLVLMLIGYLLGSVSGSLLLGRLRGVDIRTQGSGNAGATNAFRTQGRGFAALTILIDAGKGALASLLLASLSTRAEAPFACAFAAIIGHCFPVFFGFRGGKGAATAFGALLALLPQAAFLALSTWMLCLILSGYVGFSTLLAALAGVVWIAFIATLPWLTKAFAIASLLLIALLHHQNIARMLQGVEHRFEGTRVLHRWLTRTRGTADKPK